MMEKDSVREEFRNLSNFVGGLLRADAIEAPSAQEMLVKGFWEIEEEAAFEEEGEDLLAFAKEYCASNGLTKVA